MSYSFLSAHFFFITSQCCVSYRHTAQPESWSSGGSIMLLCVTARSSLFSALYMGEQPTLLVGVPAGAAWQIPAQPAQISMIGNRITCLCEGKQALNQTQVRHRCHKALTTAIPTSKMGPSQSPHRKPVPTLPLSPICSSVLIWINKLHQDSTHVKGGQCAAWFGKYFGAGSEDIKEMLKTPLLYFCCLNWSKPLN